VRIRLEDKYRDQPTELWQLPVPATKEHMPKGTIRLDQIASFEETTGPSEIDRFQRQRSIELDADLVNLPTSDAKQSVLTDSSKINMEPGYHFEFVGMAKYMKEMQGSFIMAFALSFIFMYMILASLFESWLHPVTILCSLPLAFPFAILSLIVTRESLHIISILGLFLLIGIVKKNAILQVDYTNTLRARGLPRHEAMIEACHTRLRPILMTTLTLIAGMIPVALSRGPGSASRAPMAVVIIGGQALCLLVTLLLTPVFYSIFDDAQTVWIPAWMGKIKARLGFLPKFGKRLGEAGQTIISNPLSKIKRRRKND
jgi:HAE1 family hydrophobic/amphiphilic exporter-1